MPTRRSLQVEESWRRRLFLPAYSAASAARYAGTSTRTVSYWHYRGGGLGPALPGKERRVPLSYLQLVEVAFVATFRELGVTLQRLRSAHDYLAQVFKVEFPFAQMLLKTEGLHVLMDFEEMERDAGVRRVILADVHGQLAWESQMGDRFAEFDYEKGLAVVWHLAGRQSEVAIDPRIAFGAPQIKGIPTWAIKGRHIAGEDEEEIGEDFGLSPDQVTEALSFEGLKAAA